MRESHVSGEKRHAENCKLDKLSSYNPLDKLTQIHLSNIGKFQKLEKKNLNDFFKVQSESRPLGQALCVNGHEAEGSVNAKTKVRYAMHLISADALPITSCNYFAIITYQSV